MIFRQSCDIKFLEGIMRQKLDIHPIPENVLYINELNLSNPMVYQTTPEYEKAISGDTISRGGVLPDDNVSVYVPMDLNADNIMRQLYALYDTLGNSDDSNECWFSNGVSKLISQLEIYDQVWVTRDLAHAVQKAGGEGFHSRQVIELAQKIVDFLLRDDGIAEYFPVDEIEKLKDEFWL